MKQLLITSLFILSTAIVFGQKADTLNIPLGKYGYIKIGDRVYKVITTLEISPVDQPATIIGTQIWPGYLRPAGFIDPDVMDSIRQADACNGIRVVYK